MAHLNNNSAINVLFTLEVGIIMFQVVESFSCLLKGPSILLNLVLVVIDVTLVLINIRGVLVAKSLCVLNSVLQVGGRQTKGFGGNEHVGSLGNLELVTVFTEQGSICVEGFDSISDPGHARAGRRSCSIPTVVMMGFITVIVVVVKVDVILLDVDIAGLVSIGSGGCCSRS